MPIQSLPATATDYDRQVRREQLAALSAVRRRWRTMTEDFDASWALIEPEVVAILRVAQFRIAERAAAYIPAILAATQQDVTPRVAAVVNPTEFPGFTGSGESLEAAVALAPIRAKQAVQGHRFEESYDAMTGLVIPATYIPGQSPLQALTTAGNWLTKASGTILSDTARSAESAGVTTSRSAGYVRMLTPPSCSRCAILAGRFYRWNAGFLRHPGCDCKHIPVSESMAGDLSVDPYAYFHSLDPAAQDRIFTNAGAAAIRDGADMSQVVNARSGMTANKKFTTTGTTGRGNASLGLKRGQRRMMPESIYEQAKNRDEAIELLTTHGYILPKGQVAGGALRGQVEGFGQLGGGGQRKAASAAVTEARRTGVRDPNSRYTMTAAERRLYDAKRQYETALTGTSPYTSPGFGNTPDPYGLRLNTVGATTRPVTKAELATARSTYLRELANKGSRIPLP
jgi:hypothetical protein